MSEPSTRAVQALAAADAVMLVWGAAEVECASAIARLERDGALEPSSANEAFDRLARLASPPPSSRQKAGRRRSRSSRSMSA